jgi:hypothetical protein
VRQELFSVAYKYDGDYRLATARLLTKFQRTQSMTSLGGLANAAFDDVVGCIGGEELQFCIR